jgi:hypothetical protein
MPQTLSTFDSGAAEAIVERITAYFEGLDEENRAPVFPQNPDTVKVAPAVIVSQTELEEIVYQSGHYRVGFDITVQVDASNGGGAVFKALSAATLDALQQSDLVAQLNSVKDETGRALCVVQGIVLEQSRIEDLGDWMIRRTYSVNLYGHAPLQ